MQSIDLKMEVRMIEEVNSCMIYLIHCKNLCKCHIVSPPMTIVKEKKTYKGPVWKEEED
jgi:hypothetical protein